MFVLCCRPRFSLRTVRRRLAGGHRSELPVGFWAELSDRKPSAGALSLAEASEADRRERNRRSSPLSDPTPCLERSEREKSFRDESSPAAPEQASLFENSAYFPTGRLTDPKAWSTFSKQALLSKSLENFAKVCRAAAKEAIFSRSSANFSKVWSTFRKEGFPSKSLEHSGKERLTLTGQAKLGSRSASLPTPSPQVPARRVSRIRAQEECKGSSFLTDR